MSKLVSQTKRYTKEAQDGVITHDVDHPGNSPAQTTAAFPRGGLQSTSKRDELIKEKMEFMDDQGMTPFGQVTATDADFLWLKKKRETEAFANLDAWIGKNFHVDDVAVRKWLQETYPEYYEARERLMIDRAKFALRIKLLKLRGPKNHKDLILQWGLATGRIKLDRNWDVIGAYEETPNMDVERSRYRKGLFSPLRFLSDDERAVNANDKTGFNDNPFKTTDTGNAGAQRPSMFPTGAAVPSVNRYPDFLDSVIRQAYQ